jgi:hypothetical protein
MNDAHADEMQVQTWKPNTWGVTIMIRFPNELAATLAGTFPWDDPRNAI